MEESVAQHYLSGGACASFLIDLFIVKKVVFLLYTRVKRCSKSLFRKNVQNGRTF